MAKLKCRHHIITDGCKSCFDLQMIWYEKLKDSNFDDAEDYRYLRKIDSSESDRPLKNFSTNIFASVTTVQMQSTHDYYDRALELLNNFSFKTELEKRIWELHCEGLSRMKIENAIKNWPGEYTYKQSQIRLIIKDLESEFEW